MKYLEISLIVACVAGLVGCGSDADPSHAGVAGQGNSGKPVYAIESLTFGMNEGDSSTSYVLLLDSVDTQDEIELANGRELPGLRAARNRWRQALRRQRRRAHHRAAGDRRRFELERVRTAELQRVHLGAASRIRHGRP